jgi:ABC-type iron transport system FetAB permease component
VTLHPLALGAVPSVAAAPYFQASLLPRLDMLKSLGLIIPGVMAGMVVSGASPVYAGIYQFVIVAMILAASGITGFYRAMPVVCCFCPDHACTGRLESSLSSVIG